MKKGFTLVETLVAITILLISIAGPLTIASKGLSGAYYARDQITAYYLAQEGIEYIRNVRDTHSLDGSLVKAQWLVGDDNTGGLNYCMNAFCRIDVRNTDPAVGVSSCSGDAPTKPDLHCAPLMIDTDSLGSDSLYDYSPSGVPSQFTREITIKTFADNADEVQVTSTVYWRSPLPNSSFSLTEDITNWEK